MKKKESDCVDCRCVLQLSLVVNLGDDIRLYEEGRTGVTRKYISGNTRYVIYTRMRSEWWSVDVQG